VSRLRLRGRTRRVVLYLHVLTSVGWFGVAAWVAFAFVVAGVGHDPVRAESLGRAIELAPWLSVPLGLGSAATGVVLGLGTRYGLVRYWWVVAKIAIAAAVVVTDALLTGRMAHLLVTTDQGPGALIGPAVPHLVVLGVATWLSVFKPGGRTPWAVTRLDQIAA
jgi:hypothetical protein